MDMKLHQFTFSLLAFVFLFMGSLSSCKKKKKDKENYLELIDGKDEISFSKDLKIEVQRSISTGKYSFFVVGNHDGEGDEGLIAYPSITFTFMLYDFDANSIKQISQTDNTPTYWMELSGYEFDNTHGNYRATNTLGGKKGDVLVKIIDFDMDKKKFKCEIEAKSLEGSGWAFAYSLNYEKITINFVDFTVVDVE